MEQTVRRTAAVTPQHPLRATLGAVFARLKNALRFESADHGALVAARARAEVRYQRAERDFYRPL